MPHVKGLQDTGSLRVLRIVRSKEEPGKLTTKLARLDHQRNLLERQLAVWTEKQQVTKQRLAVVQKQMEEVGRLVRALGVPRGASHKRKRTSPVAAGERRADGGVAPTAKEATREMNLEY
jgi:hypothetical protein